MRINILIPVIIFAIAYGCKKDFLNEKPSTELIVPASLDDLKGLLDNTAGNINLTSALSQMSSDEYIFMDYSSWQSTGTATERNAYIWAKDIFEGEIERQDWNLPYSSIFYANNVLKGLEKISSSSSTEYKQLKGWALFVRAFAMSDLVKTFSVNYDPATSQTDLGIPIRLNPEIDELVTRSSVQQTYDRILSDLKVACSLLPSTFQQLNRNRPSKATAFALLSRVYLSMNKYKEAEAYADSSMTLYSKLIDYNNISQTSATPFLRDNDESLFYTQQVALYTITSNSISNTRVTVNPELIKLYSSNDLRLTVFFAKNTLGNYYVKRGYLGAGSYPFTGLATDEIYLIKSECLARRNEISLSMDKLNLLLKKRYKNTVPFIPLSAVTKEDALDKIILERRKELIWRGIRWSDIKRLNKLGSNITLTRNLNGVIYTLKPNDPRYAMPIPEDEISLSGIQQNVR